MNRHEKLEMQIFCVYGVIMARFLLIRHGQTDWNVEKRIMGDRPIPLNHTGRNQAQALADAMQSYPLHHVYSSPMVRAQETAGVIAQAKNIPVQSVTSLAEIEYGQYIGKTFTEICTAKGYAPYFMNPLDPVAPDGESLQQVQDRMWNFFQTLISKHQGETVALVSHADTIKCLLIKILNMPYTSMAYFRVDHTTINLVEILEGAPRVISLNVAPSMEGIFESRKFFG